jgi:hypothetical protein
MQFEKANGLDQFYSRMTAGGKIELFVDKWGNPTTGYPHVHVIHHGSGTVEVLASTAGGEHAFKTSLNNPSGNEVNSAVSEAQTHI